MKRVLKFQVLFFISIPLILSGITSNIQENQEKLIALFIEGSDSIEISGKIVEVVEISPLVGEIIDKNENERFALLDIKDLKDVIILKVDKSYYLLIRLKTEDISLKPLSDSSFASIREKLRKEEALGIPLKPVKYQIDPNRTRLFIMPTGNTLNNGQKYFADYELVFTWFGIGITNNFMIDFGVTLIPTTPDNWLYYFGPKVKVYESGGGSYLSCGAHFVALPFVEESEDQIWGAAYISFTRERPGTQITFGGGLGNAILTPIGGDLFGAYIGFKRGMGRVKLLAEYWHLLIKWDDEYHNVPNLFIGARFCGENLSADFGLLYPHMIEFLDFSPVGIPFLNFVYFF